MRVAIISPGFMPVPDVCGGAIETLVTYIINENEQYRKVNIEVYTIADSRINENQYTNTRIIQIKRTFAIKAFYKFLNGLTKEKKIFYFDKTLRLVEKRACLYDFIIVENNIDLLLKILKKGTISKNKLLFHFHNDIDTLEYSKDKFLKLAQSHIPIIGVSQYICDRVRKFYPGIETYLLKNAIDLKQFSVSKIEKYRTEFRRKLGIADHDKIVLFVGRIVDYKGTMELVKAMTGIIDSNIPNVTLVIIGSHDNHNGSSDAYTDEIKRVVEKYKERIKLLGFINHANIHYYYMMSDIVILPSKCQEAASLVPLEAKAMGKACIVTNVGGVIEYNPKDTVVYVDISNDLISEIKNAILSLINNPDRMKYIAQKGYMDVQKYNIHSYYENWCQVLEKIAKEHRVQGET